MKKKLPNVYVNSQDKKIMNNKETFYSRDFESLKKEEEANNYIEELLVRKKISDIFSSTHFVYKIKARIKTGQSDKTETIIAKTKDQLITIKNEKINISDIKDIEIIPLF